MTAKVVAGRWTRLRARVRKRLAGVDDDGLDVFLGQLRLLASKVQPAHGIPPEEIEQQVRDWQRLLESSGSADSSEPTERSGKGPRVARGPVTAG